MVCVSGPPTPTETQYRAFDQHNCGRRNMCKTLLHGPCPQCRRVSALRRTEILPSLDLCSWWGLASPIGRAEVSKGPASASENILGFRLRFRCRGWLVDQAHIAFSTSDAPHASNSYDTPVYTDPTERTSLLRCCADNLSLCAAVQTPCPHHAFTSGGFRARDTGLPGSKASSSSDCTQRPSECPGMSRLPSNRSAFWKRVEHACLAPFQHVLTFQDAREGQKSLSRA